MLQNNNQSMATVVETFIIEETSELIYDGEALQKWNDRIAELELEGQKEVVVKDKSPIPFLWMNQGLIATFETLCPVKVRVEKYSKTPIPVEILDLVALSKREQYFDFVEIWYNDQDKDPVAVGYLVQADYKEKEEWYQKIYSQKYLIGRWADVKASLDTLTKKAKELWVVMTGSELKQTIKNNQRRLEDLEEEANSKFGGTMPFTDNLPF